MKNPIHNLQKWFDKAAEQSLRRSAQLQGRRHVMTRLGGLMVGAAVVPMLPFDRSGKAHAAESAPEWQTDDDTECDYWRYCALGGTLCTCCGGSVTTCPPGSEVSQVSWVGTCENPMDGKSYLVSYNDCCGQMVCGRCRCHNAEGERPGYRLGLHNGINWCMANNAQGYHCTVAALVGVAD